jgi:hypothetical protein
MAKRKRQAVRKKSRKPVLFVLGGGIGNIIQATPAINAVSAAGWTVDLLLHCNSSSDFDIFKIPSVRHIFQTAPNAPGGVPVYAYQLNGPFTPGKKLCAEVKFTPRISYAQHLPESKIYLDLAHQMGVDSLKFEPQVEINVGTYGPFPKNPETVAIYCGSKHNWAMKRWDKYDELASHFDNVVVVGTTNDIYSHGNPAWIKRKWNWPKNTEIFMGTLQEAAFLISKCKMFIGNDGGLAHVAAATGVPTHILFGPSSDVKNKPLAQNVKVIALDLPCRPCQFKADKTGKQIFRGDKADCPKNMKCMRDMSVAYVLKNIRNNHS